MLRWISLSAAVATLTMTLASPMPAATLVFQNGLLPDGVTPYDGQVDNYLDNVRRNLNYGAAGLVQISNNQGNYVARGILRFDDIAPYIPAGEVVSSATLELKSFNTPAMVVDTDVQLYAINTGNAGWVEGTSNGGPVEDGTSVWESKAVDAAFVSPTLWVGGPGLGNPGDGYGLTPLDTPTALVSQSVTTLTYSLPASLVQSWIDNPSSNAGLLLRVPDEANDAAGNGQEFFTTIHSAENTNTGARPILRIETVPEPGSLTLLGIGMGLLAWRSRPHAS